MTARRYIPGQGITAQQLNEAVDAVNRLDRSQLPTQDRSADDAPLITDDQKDALPNIIVWDEVYRETSEVRITNPEDENQYVDVDRVEAITFRNPEGELILLRLSN